MPKAVKHYLDIDVEQAARERIRHAFDLFDTVFVSFSGGKDSLVTLNLVHQEWVKAGYKEKLRVVFRDEELITQNVIDFVQQHANSGVYDFRYYCTPLKSEKFLMGKKYKYIQWDDNRDWIRPKPEPRLRFPYVLDQFNSDAAISAGEKGKIAFFTGIRADESLIRRASVMNKLHEPYIAATNDPRSKMVKPVYDWSEDDIFKFLYDNNIPYAPTYNDQMYNGETLRVATPLLSDSSKKLWRIKTRDPVFYDQLMQIFPEIDVQARYSRDISTNKDKIIYSYPLGWQGIIQYINETIDNPDLRNKAIKFVNTAHKTRARKIKMYPDTYGGYPVHHVFTQVINGNKRTIQPVSKVTAKQKAYEEAMETYAATDK